jgi:hypothetical protein
MRLPHLFLSILFILVSCSAGDRNCNDANAKNFSKRADTDEGCIYNEVSRTPTLLTDLVKKVKETSGLALFDGDLFTHNDRGNENKIYHINKESGEVMASITIENTTNEDWEELAQSESHLFIGDMGNNDGDRRNLRIFIVQKSAFLQGTGDRSVPISGVIEFSYPEQTVFFERRHNFDCEAMFFLNDQLYLFTKHRADDRTNLYRLPATTGVYDAEMIASFPAGGRITGADISPNGRKVILCGHIKSADAFLWELTDFSGDNFFSGKKKRISLGSFPSIGQVEAVVFKDDSTLYITSEKVKEYNLPARLYSLRL